MSEVRAYRCPHCRGLVKLPVDGSVCNCQHCGKAVASQARPSSGAGMRWFALAGVGVALAAIAGMAIVNLNKKPDANQPSESAIGQPDSSAGPKTAPGAQPASPTAPSEVPRPRPSASPPTTAAASSPEADPLAAERARAAKALDTARAQNGTGDLMAAQKTLVGMLNSTDKDAWPAGAVELLNDLKRRLAATPAKPDPEELARQVKLAKDAYSQALALEKKGDYSKAQQLLLDLMNTYHSDAWPEDTRTALTRIQKAANAPASRPTFFGTPAR